MYLSKLRNQNWCITVQFNSVCLDFTWFFTNVLFLFQGSVQCTSLHLVIMSLSLGSSGLWQFLRLSTFFMTLAILRSTGEWFCGLPLSWGLSEVFLRIRLGLWFLRRNTLEMKCPLQRILSGAMTLTWPIAGGGDLDRLVEVVLARFLHHKVTVFLFPYHILWKWVS